MSRYVDIEPLDSLVFTNKSEDFVAGVQWVLEKLDECRELSVSGDCIDRKEAIKKFMYNYKGERIPDYDCDNFPTQISFIDVRNTLRELPSVEPTPKWIPVNERLPEVDVDVLVTDIGGGVPTVIVDACGIKDDTGERFWYISQTPVAWREWLEPYKAESEDKE